MKPPSSFKRKAREENKPYLSLKHQEKRYLNRWLKQKGQAYLQKFENVPEVIVTSYEKDLAEKKIVFNNPFTSPERLYFIKSKLYWHLHLNPQFQKILKVAGITSAQFGLMFGYCSMHRQKRDWFWGQLL